MWGSRHSLCFLADLDLLSGGARVFAARGKCRYCRPRQSDQFCNQGIFRISDMGCKPILFPSLSFPSLSCSLLSHASISHGSPSPPLEVDPLNLSRRSGQRYKLPSGVWGEPQPKLNLVHFSLKNLTSGCNRCKDFTGNQITKFMQNFLILCRI